MRTQPPDRMQFCRYATERSPLPMVAAEGLTHLVRYVNPAFCHLSGKDKTELVGRSFADAVPEGAENGCIPLLDRVYHTGEAASIGDQEHTQGRLDPVYWSYTVWAILDAEECPAGVMIQVTDTTESALNRQRFEKVNAEVREINQQLLIAGVHQLELAEVATEAEEVRMADQIHIAEQSRQAAVLEERNRFAREIHDTLAQSFTGILIQLGVAQRIAKWQPEEAWSLIEHIAELARQGLAEARRSVWALQPEALEYSDLASVLPRTIAQMTADTSLQGEVHIHGTPRSLPADVGMNLLRIGQEAVNNALHHANAQKIFLELTFDAEQVRLYVQDDGQGFDPQYQEEGGGFGLIGMRQRAARIGGQLTIASQPGRGTEVAVIAPIAAAQHGEEVV